MDYSPLFFIIGALSKLKWSARWRAARTLKATIICANNSDKADSIYQTGPLQVREQVPGEEFLTPYNIGRPIIDTAKGKKVPRKGGISSRGP